MDCLQNLRFSAPSSRCFKKHTTTGSNTTSVMGRVFLKNLKVSDTRWSIRAMANNPSETYSHNMTESMGAVSTYRHENGMNYDFIRPDLIVGSCVQNTSDVDRLRRTGVKTIFCLQQNSDLEYAAPVSTTFPHHGIDVIRYFGVDIDGIRRYAEECGDIQHVRAEVRDFDGFDLRMRLPAVVAELFNAVNRNGGVTYVHCTAGLGRAPAVTLAYMFWIHGYSLEEAHKLIQSKRPCFPKLDAITSATADILTGLRKKKVGFTWKSTSCSSVGISGLDVGWTQVVPLTFNQLQQSWMLQRDLPEGYYEYKYVVDGKWMCNESEPVAKYPKDGHVNNFVQVLGEEDESTRCVRKKLTGDKPNLTMEERLRIRQFLKASKTQ